MKKLLGILILLACCWLVEGNGAGQVQLPGATLENLEWGETSGGLQMAVKRGGGPALLYCWLRNATDGTLSYCAWGLGYHESVQLEVQVGDVWVKLPRVETPWRGYTGIGPDPRDMRKLAARELIGRHRGGLTGIRSYGRWQAPMTEVWVAEMLGSFRSERGFTYLEDLLDFVWPEKVLAGSKVKVRVVQRLAVQVSNDGFSNWVAVTSPTAETDGQALKQMVEEANRLWPQLIAEDNRRVAQALDEAKRSRLQRTRSPTNSPAQKQ